MIVFVSRKALFLKVANHFQWRYVVASYAGKEIPGSTLLFQGGTYDYMVHMTIYYLMYKDYVGPM